MTKSEYIEHLHNFLSLTIQDEKIKLSNPKDIDSLYDTVVKRIRIIESAYNALELEDNVLKEYFDIAKNIYTTNNPISMDHFNALTKKGYKTWLTEERFNEINWQYRERYLSYLKKSGRPESVIEETDNSSKEILGKLGDPQSTNVFFVKGLVVGSVQSGKTGNFNAVINGAIDAGYKIIIVLAGLYNDLRSQTQLRIESDVIGWGIVDIEKGSKGKVGVGQIPSNLLTPVQAITSYEKDFEKALVAADFNPNAQTNILVCKKNTSVLRNLLIWLDDYLDDEDSQHKMPLLILDDEADNASLNNSGSKGRNYASKINAQIRALLGLFKRKTYLGYTATPFANVLQDRNEAPEMDFVFPYKYKGIKVEKSISQVDNIFPDDFIVLLNPPSNYIGAKAIFDTIIPPDNSTGEKLPVVEVVNDNVSQFPTRVYKESCKGVIDFRSKEEFEFNGGCELFPDYKTYRSETRASSAVDEFPKVLPRSLQDSILCFILSIAVRESRKEIMVNSPYFNPHHTMLIHVSRFTLWQNRTQKLVKKYIEDIKSELENNDVYSPIFREFQSVWTEYYSSIMGSIQDYLPSDYVDPYLTPISFETIRNRYLVNTLDGIDVKAINSITKETLEYPKKTGKKVIAIGGNRLSRGFTLEGLTVNYFIRTTNYSDTLLQMGRWFGYRPGYLDCCKLFATQDSISKFNSTSLVIEELEGEFRKMEERGKTPSNFELRVRKHPGTLKVTRPSILKNSKVVKWSYQDHLEMTTKFVVTKNKMDSVWSFFRKSIAPLLTKVHQNGEMLFYETDIAGVISILNSANNFDEITNTTMIKFLELCDDKGKLQKWTVALKTTGKAQRDLGKGILSIEETGLHQEVTMAVRSGHTKSPYRELLLDDKIFKPTGKSANIMTSPKDFSILLDPINEIPFVENKFIEEKIRDFKKKDPNLTRDDARKKIKQIPERVYRENFSEQEGILVIYLFDTYYSLLQHKGSEDKEFSNYVKENQIDLDTPLVGYAIGFPPILDDPGGTYVQGDYDLDIDDENDFDESTDDSELPDDSLEAIYAN